ncbi:hypothetical protein BCR37DRAFT_390312 [Protomyces lactucae-debilis]|uniref:Uncharacterized protein n=1 Tax=Protomyces lactucae-debilis TaxID=2754530 RepID=A0A1Y2FUV0_PROLT|nr:uncharacterized protein BCR37DRAFT_390312 [Protomyces lactucae-debilis]ORY87793.1 hypothetical protein BCR37DRAFT_390312 [Protomyces lactucae-debilis]
MPIRKYLRISQGAALELRIYVAGEKKNWFDEQVLSELVQLIKPLVLPKLREERDAAKKKKGPTKDTVEGTSLWFVDTDTRHVVMKTDKQLVFNASDERDQSTTAPEQGASSPLFIPSPEAEDERKKAKPTLVAKYRGFSIWGKKLMISVSAKEVSEGAATQAPSQQQLMDN